MAAHRCLSAFAVGLGLLLSPVLADIYIPEAPATNPATSPSTKPSTQPASRPTTLPAADAAELDRLFKRGLFDATTRPFVRFQVSVRNFTGGGNWESVVGFLMEPRADDGEHRLPYAILLDGSPRPITTRTEPADFLKECQRIINAAESQPAADNRFGRADDVFWDDRDSVIPAKPSRFLAAWLHRLGHNAAAARMLELRRAMEIDADPNKPSDEEIQVPRKLAAWNWYSRGAQAFVVRADAEALFYLRWQVRFFPDSIKPLGRREDPDDKTDWFPQGGEMLAELQRREREGTFGKPPPATPKEIASWPVNQRIDYWISRLEDVDSRSIEHGGFIQLYNDARVDALIKIGDPAVPALIDCLDRDRRLTRSMHLGRESDFQGTVIGVREAALTAIMCILRTREFQAERASQNFTARGPDVARGMARRLRDYWRRYGHLPFDERMMAILQAPDTHPEIRQEAASNLEQLGGELRYSSAGNPYAKARNEGVPNPALAKFKNPTVAEAILRAMDLDLAYYDRQRTDSDVYAERRTVPYTYLEELQLLGDRSILPALQARLAGPMDSAMRVRMTGVCFAFDDLASVQALCSEFRRGKLLPHSAANRWPPFPYDETLVLTQTVELLLQAQSRVPACDGALRAIAREDHPYYPLLVENVYQRAGIESFRGMWTDIRLALPVLTNDLEDESPTRVQYRVGHNSILLICGERANLPSYLQNPELRNDEAEERACDRAAMILSNAIIGVPKCHALFKDRDERIAALKRFIVDRGARLREANPAEVAAISGGDLCEVRYLLDMPRGKKGASEEDVRNGRAIFEFGGEGKPLELPLPAKAILQPVHLPTVRPSTLAADYFSDRRTSPTPVLILQAERGPDGKNYYGIATTDKMWRVTEDELRDIESINSR
jgi:hypothetical protein